jgi:hypothetical protein
LTVIRRAWSREGLPSLTEVPRLRHLVTRTARITVLFGCAGDG